MSGTWYGGTVPRTARCPERRAHWAHVWYDPLTVNCPGGPDEDQERGKTCHCDGPPHEWAKGWCPPGGPVTHG